MIYTPISMPTVSDLRLLLTSLGLSPCDDKDEMTQQLCDYYDDHEDGLAPRALLRDVQAYLDGTKLKFDETSDVVVYPFERITLYSYETRIAQTYTSDRFTARRLLLCVQEFEGINRPHTDWFGEPDTSHVFFEGMARVHDSTIYTINWGS